MKTILKIPWSVRGSNPSRAATFHNPTFFYPVLPLYAPQACVGNPGTDPGQQRIQFTAVPLLFPLIAPPLLAELRIKSHEKVTFGKERDNCCPARH